jgi:hypothetical protein
VNGGVDLCSVMETRFVTDYDETGTTNGGSLTRRVGTGEQKAK